MMSPFDVIQGFLERARQDPLPLPSLAAAFAASVEALGFRHFACCSHVDPCRAPAEAVMLHNYPRGWARTFSEARLYEIDPVLQRARSQSVPFFWDTALRADGLTELQKLILADAAGYGLCHGYTVPLHLSWLPGSLRASCSVVPDAGSIDRGSYLAIEVLANHFYFFASRAHAPWLTPSPVVLTERERECLALVAQGKDDWTIGRVLALGQTTAHYHVQQLKKRLGVTTRAQAVARALISGQLSFGEIVRRTDADRR